MNFAATLVVGGKVGDEAHRLFMIYNEGNFIEATAEMPYFQLGEYKFGRPILDWFVTQELALEDAVMIALLSMGNHYSFKYFGSQPP